MADANEIAKWQQIIDADPRWQALLAKYFGPDAKLGGVFGSLDESARMQAEAQQMGLPMPPADLHFGRDGRLTQDSSAMPIILGGAGVLGGAFAAPFLAGALGGGGGAAASSSGGLTPAMTASAPAIASQGVSATAASTPWWQTALNAAGPIGDALTGASAGMAGQRQDNNQMAALYYNALTNGARDQYNADARNYEYQRDAPDIRSRQAARGDMLANVQDVHIGRPSGSTIPTFNYTGGLRPSALGPNARQAGSEMSRQALLKLMEGEQLPQYQAPKAPTLDTGGFLENFLGGAGLGLNIYDAVRR